MWDSIKALFGEPDTTATETSGVDRTHLAAAALLVEAAQMDGEFSTEERDRVFALLRDHLGLNDWATTELLEAAEKEAAAASDFHGFTRDLKDAFDAEGRIRIMEMLWEVAYADGELHDYEASLMRRIAGLLYVTDRDSGEARKRVVERLGLANR